MEFSNTNNKIINKIINKTINKIMAVSSTPTSDTLRALRLSGSTVLRCTLQLLWDVS